MKRKNTPRPGNAAQGQGWALVGACPTCGADADRCRCSAAARSAHIGPAVARLRMEKRRGKPITVVDLAGLDDTEVRALARELKQLCGSGGTARGTTLEVQGEHRERLRAELREKGLQVKG